MKDTCQREKSIQESAEELRKKINAAVRACFADLRSETNKEPLLWVSLCELERLLDSEENTSEVWKEVDQRTILYNAIKNLWMISAAASEISWVQEKVEEIIERIKEKRRD